MMFTNNLTAGNRSDAEKAQLGGLEIYADFSAGLAAGRLFQLATRSSALGPRSAAVDRQIVFLFRPKRAFI